MLTVLLSQTSYVIAMLINVSPALLENIQMSLLRNAMNAYPCVTPAQMELHVTHANPLTIRMRRHVSRNALMRNGQMKLIIFALTACLIVKNAKPDHSVTYVTLVITGMEEVVHKHVAQDIMEMTFQEHARNV